MYRAFHYQLRSQCTERFTINSKANVQSVSLSTQKPVYRAVHYQLKSQCTERFTINSKANVQRVSLSTQKPLYRGFHYQLTNHCTKGFTINSSTTVHRVSLSNINSQVRFSLSPATSAVYSLQSLRLCGAARPHL